MMGRERRQFPRVPHPFDVRYRPAGTFGATWQLAQTVNLSAGGLRFCTEDMFELGDLLETQIELPGMHAPLVLQGRVIWKQLLAAGVLEYGVEFLDVGPDQQVQIDQLVAFLQKNG